MAVTADRCDKRAKYTEVIGHSLSRGCGGGDRPGYRASEKQSPATLAQLARNFASGSKPTEPRGSFARMSRRIEKPWGHEEIWAETPRYLGKILTIRAGHRLSLQLHREKDEAIYVLRGTLRLTLESDAGDLEVRDLEKGASTRIAPGRRHRFEALSDCELCEVSSPEIDDVVRLQDDYGRVPGSGRA